MSHKAVRLSIPRRSDVTRQVLKRPNVKIGKI